MRKKFLILLLVLSLFAAIGTASAAATLELIQAHLNHGISFLLNGKPWTPADASGNKVVPISYEGTTYVPLRAVAEATGADIGWDGDTQTISISTEPTEPVRKPFSSDVVLHVKKSATDKSGITRNKEELLFGETQYTAAFIIPGIGRTTGESLTFKVPDGTSRVGVLIGFKKYSEGAFNNDFDASYTIGTEDTTLAAGNLINGQLVENIIELPKGVTELTVKMVGPNGSSSTGYIIWDESWLE